VDHVIQVLKKDGTVESFLSVLKKMVVASIGPTASERLRQHEWPIDLEPPHPKMGILVKEASERAHALLQQKQSA
jgi:uroporphyrinogen-III synthase